MLRQASPRQTRREKWNARPIASIVQPTDVSWSKNVLAASMTWLMFQRYGLGSPYTHGVDGDYRVLPFGELMDWTAAATPAPGGGSIAALTIGLSASLVAMVARSSRDSWPDAAGV